MNQIRGTGPPGNPPKVRGVEWAYVRWSAVFGAALQGFWLVTSVYIVIEVGLTPLTLLLLGTALEVTILLAEVPTGVMADTISRKWSIVVSMLVTAVAFVIAGLAGSFVLLLVSKVLWGIGYTFTSGANVAWISDELAIGGASEEEIDRAITRSARWQQRGGAAGLVAFGLLGYLTSMSFAMISAGALLVGLGLWVAVLFPENGFTPTVDGRGGESIRILHAGLNLVKSDRTVLALLGVTMLFNLGAEAVDRLTELRLIDLGLPDLGFAGLDLTGDTAPVLFFTGLGIVGLVAGAALLKVAEPHIASDNGPRLVYGAMALLAAVGALIIAGAPTAMIGAVGVFLARGLAWSVLPVVSSVWINRSTASETRATVQSFLGQAVSAGQIAGGLLLGAVAAIGGLTAAILTSAVLFGLSGYIILRTGARD